MQVGYSFLINTSKCLQQLKRKQQSVLVLLFLLLNILSSKRHHVDSSLLIGAIFTTDGATVFPNGTANTNLFEPDEEIVFKHAVYISNQNKFGSNGIGSNGAAGAAIPASAAAAAAAMALGNSYTTLLHKIIHVTQTDQLKTIKKICQETSGNLLALIGPHEESLKMYSRSLAEQLDLIHFDLDAAIEPSYSFNLYPATDVMCQAFADLIKRFEWRNLAIIYHSKTNLKKVKCLLSGPGKSVPKLDITLRIVNFEYEFRVILRDLSRRSIRNIILDLEPEESQVVLKMALQLGMINSSYHFIMTSLDVETINLDDFKYNRANLTALRIIKSDSAFYKTIALNLTDYYSNNLINNNDKNKILLNTKNALMFDAVYLFATAIKAAERSIRGLESGNVSCQEDKILDIGAQLSMLVENVNLRGLTGSISFRNKQRREFELDVLQLKESGLFKCGSWSSQHGLNFTFYDELFDDDMLSYKKNTFRVVTLVEEPYVMEKDGKLEGFCIDILNEIAQKMNFRYEIYKVPDNQYGNEDENGTWNGMIRELIDKKADMAISALTINFKRQQAVDFTKPFLNLGISILYKVPRSKKPGLFSFLNPLSLEIWICTLITYILISLIMMILARFSPYEWRNKHPCNLNNEYVENQFTVWNSLWFAMGTLMQQGSDINPKALSTRLVGGVWWFFTLIIISSYTANLAAFLTVEKFDISITNVEQLANQTKVAYGVFKGGSTMNFFKESKIDTYRRMWRYMDHNPHAAFVSSNAEGIKRVHERDFAYLMESPLIDYEIQKNCSLTQVGGLLDTKGYGIATQLGSPYTDDISLQILEMQEKGTIQKFYNQWWKAGSTCGQNEKKDTKPDPLKVENVGGIFVVLIGGLFLACVVSLFEFLYYAKQNSKKIHKPLCTQMFDDLRFAIKCGGSAKKVQLSGSTAIPLKKLKSQMQMPKIRRSFSEASGLERALLNQQQMHVQQQHQASLLVNPSSSEAANVTRSGSARSVSGSGANKAAGGRDCRKCKDIIRNELLDQITPENAIVCKHDSTTNVSIHNPGLLIVDKDTAFDAHAALINSHILPPANHPHMHISHQSAETSFNGGLCHSIASSSSKKSPVKGVSGTKHIDSQSNLIDNNNEYFMIQNANNTSNYRPGPQQSQPSHPHAHHAQHQHYQNNRNNSQQQELEIPINRYSNNSGGNNMSAASTNIGAVDFFLAGGGGDGSNSQQHQHQQHHSSHPYPHPHSHSNSLSPPSSSSSHHHQQQQQQQQNELKNRTDGKFYAPTKSSKINTNRYI